MARDDDLAICYANLKGVKNKDLIGTARALERLKALPEFRSNARLGTTLGVSGEIVRQFLTLLSFPPQIQAYFEQGRLGLEQGRRLWQFREARRDSAMTKRLADAMLTLNAHDSRHLVEYLLSHPESTVEHGQAAVLSSKTITRKVYGIVASLSADQYDSLRQWARKRHVTVNDLVKTIVEDWLLTQK